MITYHIGENYCYDMEYNSIKETITIDLQRCAIFSKIFKIPLHKFIATGLSHEFLHHLIKKTESEQACAAFDDITGECEEYGM